MTWPLNHKKPDIAALNTKFKALDDVLGFEVSDDFVPFEQRNDMFTRAFWDDAAKGKDAQGFFESYRMEAAPRRGDGFTQKDFALRNASWLISDIISNRGAAEGKREGFQSPMAYDTPVALEKFEVEGHGAQAREIKRLAKLFGADLCGITEIDPRWHYSAQVDTRDFSSTDNSLPDGLTHVIVLGHAMDFDLVETYPSALAGASTGREYSHEAAICQQLAAYIRNLGHDAVASMNDTALVIPYAVIAGLGEYGCNQMVLTPEFGPRLRFSKILTSLPMEFDQPKPLGLKQYCMSCTKCATACPPKALPFGGPEEGSDSPSTLNGVKKWSANCEKCFGYWAKLKTDCAICMRVCPFNRQYNSWAERLWRRIAVSRYRKLAQIWEGRRPKRQRLKPSDWWAKS
jgi:epoxyqueuosine reductase